MSNQVLQWQKQHQSDLKMLAAKETQLREFQEEMATLKESLLADEKEVGTVWTLSLALHTSRLGSHWGCQEQGTHTHTLFCRKQILDTSRHLSTHLFSCGFVDRY